MPQSVLLCEIWPCFHSMRSKESLWVNRVSVLLSFFLARCSFYFFVKLHPLLKACIQIVIYNLFTDPSHFSRIPSLHLAVGSSPFPSALLFIYLFVCFPPLSLPRVAVVFLAFRLVPRVGRFPALLSPRNVFLGLQWKFTLWLSLKMPESHTSETSRFCGLGITPALIGFEIVILYTTRKGMKVLQIWKSSQIRRLHW